MKYPLIRVKKCERCNGTTALVNEYGMFKPCDECSVNYKKFVNLYGTDNEEAPEFYIDEEKRVMAVIDRKKEYINLPNGEYLERLSI